MRQSARLSLLLLGATSASSQLLSLRLHTPGVVAGPEQNPGLPHEQSTWTSLFRGGIFRHVSFVSRSNDPGQQQVLRKGQVSVVNGKFGTVTHQSETLCRDGKCQTKHSGMVKPAWSWLPNLRGAAVTSFTPTLADAPKPSVVDDAVAKPLSESPEATGAVEDASLVYPTAALIGLTGIASMAVLLAMLRCQSQSSRDMSSVRSLSEALAPVQEAIGTWQQWVEEAKHQAEAAPIEGETAASGELEDSRSQRALGLYLSGVYNRASQIVDERATRGYLVRVYEKAAA